jgi:hypothetical protein
MDSWIHLTKLIQNSFWKISIPMSSTWTVSHLQLNNDMELLGMTWKSITYTNIQLVWTNDGCKQSGVTVGPYYIDIWHGTVSRRLKHFFGRSRINAPTQPIHVQLSCQVMSFHLKQNHTWSFNFGSGGNRNKHSYEKHKWVNCNDTKIPSH